jgi:hypothetical protein
MPDLVASAALPLGTTIGFSKHLCEPLAAIMRTTQCRFKIVVCAQDGWICGAVQCDAEQSFLDFDAHG